MPVETAALFLYTRNPTIPATAKIPSVQYNTLFDLTFSSGISMGAGIAAAGGTGEGVGEIGTTSAKGAGSGSLT